jgi:D-tagatose 6-phosphate 4-epimerase
MRDSFPELTGNGPVKGLVSVCSAHPVVIETAVRTACDRGLPILIEATCNQVNQDGGYTGMTPAQFRRFVAGIAASIGAPEDLVILGGDHLGPNPWRHLPAAEAMDRATVMVTDYAAAGFRKLHLDCSMACADDPAPLPEPLIAARAARLADHAEAAARFADHPPPVYVIGTEVPVPGGATDELDPLHVTSPAAARMTVDLHRAAFAALGLADAFRRCIALVVQPGVEFSQTDVLPYDPARATALVQGRATVPGFVYEAHSTDYQTAAALAALVRDGFAILKVGPGLTFALRAALYDLASRVGPSPDASSLPDVMEHLMLARPTDWSGHCSGDAAEQRRQRHEGLSDRIRYYWTETDAQAAVGDLLRRADTAAGEGQLSLDGAATAHDFVSRHVARVLDDYWVACAPAGG